MNYPGKWILKSKLFWFNFGVTISAWVSDQIGFLKDHLTPAFFLSIMTFVNSINIALRTITNSPVFLVKLKKDDEALIEENATKTSVEPAKSPDD